MFGSRRGDSPVPLVISVVLSLVFIFLCWHCYSAGEEARKDLESSERSYNEAKESESKLERDVKELSNLVGFIRPTERGGAFYSSYEAIIAKLCYLCNSEEAKRRYNLNLPTIMDVEPDVKIDPETNEEMENPRKGLIKLDKLMNDADVRQMPKLENVWNACLKRIGNLQDELKQEKDKLKRLEDEYTKKVDEKRNALDKIDGDIQKQKDDIKDLAEREEKKLKEAEDQRNAVRLEKQSENEKVAKLVQQKIEEKAQFEAELEKLESRVKEMEAVAAGSTGIMALIEQKKAEKKPEEIPDGEIIFSDHDNGVAYINIGRPEGVIPGLKFDVYRFEKGGAKVLKGYVEVKKVQDKMSLVGILKTEDPLKPISAGDVIINNVFDKDKTKYFVFAGKLSQRYSNEEAKSLIEELGGKVEDTISARTDYVVLGNNYQEDPNYKRAVEVGIETMRESDLLRYIGD